MRKVMNIIMYCEIGGNLCYYKQNVFKNEWKTYYKMFQILNIYGPLYAINLN